jgi:hypothetical protein
VQEEQKPLADDMRRQAEHAAALAVWVNEGGRDGDGRYEDRALALNPASGTRPGVLRKARAGTILPPIWGQILRDSRPWASIRQAHPSYPEQPERHVIYAHPSGVRI